ncbi:carbohydrate ABC transporter permease [Halorubrum tibetense]|uniref:Carbohydrate ABC transporter permease n=1 Tax=Halorubrum tibetense TaxID=175631 RepID=A0ABD5SEJ4_9EURY
MSGDTGVKETPDRDAEVSLFDRVDRIDRSRVALYAVLLGMVAFYLAPLESGLMTAFKTTDGFRATTPFAPPPAGEFTLDAWQVAFQRLSTGLTNSAMMAIPATVLSAFFGSIAAYGLTNLNWRGQIGVLTLFVAGVFIPYQAVLVPLTQFWSFVDLGARIPLAFVDDYQGLINLSITHTAYGIPICTVLFRAYYATLDDEMLEAARLDGASAMTIYRRIVLPLSVPIFAVTLIYQFTQVWNDLLFAIVLVSDPSNQVVTVALNQLQGSFVQEYNLQMAGAFIAALPTLIVYVLFGEQFAKGVAGDT